MVVEVVAEVAAAVGVVTGMGTTEEEGVGEIGKKLRRLLQN